MVMKRNLPSVIMLEKAGPLGINSKSFLIVESMSNTSANTNISIPRKGQLDLIYLYETQ